MKLEKYQLHLHNTKFSIDKTVYQLEDILESTILQVDM